MTYSNVFAALVVLCFTGLAIWVIVRGWRTSEEAGNTRRKASHDGQAFSDATIVLTVVSILDKMGRFPSDGAPAALVVKIVAGFGMLIALVALPSLARPLIALLAGVFVAMGFGFPTSIILLAAYVVVALVITRIRH